MMIHNLTIPPVNCGFITVFLGYIQSYPKSYNLDRQNGPNDLVNNEVLYNLVYFSIG